MFPRAAGGGARAVPAPSMGTAANPQRSTGHHTDSSCLLPPCSGALSTLGPPRQRLGPFLRTPQTCPHPSWHRSQRPDAARLSCLQTRRSTDGRVAPAGGWARRSSHDLIRPWAVGCTRAAEKAGRPGGAFGIGQAGTPTSLPWQRWKQGCPLSRRGPRGGAGG